MVIARCKLERRKLGRLVVIAGALLAASGYAGCASLGGSRANCNVVQLQRGAGRSDSDIASALGVDESDVAACTGAGSSGDSGSGGGDSGEPSKPPM
jgi:hypothetical protein